MSGRAVLNSLVLTRLSGPGQGSDFSGFDKFFNLSNPGGGIFAAVA
jgi:hypothetical protein